MSDFKPHAFSELRAWAARKRRKRRLQREKERTVREATEGIVDATDPRIRQVGGYRKKLRPAVEAAMRFADALVEGLPGPIEVGKETWATNPYVRAFFASVDEMQEVLRGDRDLEAFFKSQPLTECYALLTMSRRERTVFGTEKVGEIIRRDVAKTAVNFVDHRLVSPCGTEAETRAVLKAQTLSVLSDYASEKLISSRVERDELQAEKELVKVKLKVLQEEFNDSHPLENGGDEPERSKISEARALLTEIDRRIGQLNRLLNDPGNCLGHLADMLSHPLDILKPQTVTLRLNPMGIKVRQGSDAALGKIELAEVELRKGVKRIAAVVKLQRAQEWES